MLFSIVGFFFLLFRPYIISLNNYIWKTKGMLNMIPLEVLNKYQNLKDIIISRDIINAVKWKIYSKNKLKTF